MKTIEFDAFIEKWKKAYQIINKTTFSFGTNQHFQITTIGKYYLLKNTNYQNKRPSQYVVKAHQTKSTMFEFDPSKFNFNQVKQEEILFQFNQNILEVGFKYSEKHIQANECIKHSILISGTPICMGHSLFIPYIQNNLPQTLNTQLIQSLLFLSRILPQSKIGYNSQGAASSVNHFHAQIIYPKYLINKQTFNFESIQGQVYSKFNQIKIYHFTYCGALFIKFISGQLNKVDAELLACVAQYLLQKSIPHNLVVTNHYTVYFILRDFATEQYKYGFLEYCGILIAKPQAQLMTQVEIDCSFDTLHLKNKVTILEDLLQIFCNNKKFQQRYDL